MDRIELLKEVLQKAGPERIRRPIYSVENNLLAKGIADERDGDPEDLQAIDFSGKTVVDLGCNFGFHSFFVKQRGAGHVLGIDLDELAIQGCHLIKEIKNTEGIQFQVSDFSSASFSGEFDITLLLDFFGKANILEGINIYLDAVERITKQSMVMSARTHYRIEKYFNGHFDTLKNYYSPEFVKENRIYLINYIKHYFKNDWQMSILSPDGHDSGSKKTLLFERK